jgi:hypothetical protein
MKKMYTVTTVTTHFTEAEDATEALNIVYEALLGNDVNDILGNGEIHQTSMVVKEGFHSTIKHGEDYDWDID